MTGGTLRGQRVVVVGLGRSGRAAARLAMREGASVTAVDERTDADPVDGAQTELGPFRDDAFVHADLLVVSPGVAAAHPAVAAARAAGVDVVGELGFAARYVDAPIVGITGTNGKSTVTTFTGALLAEPGKRVFVGGNLGSAFCEAALGPAPDLCVVEVSSYQLELPGTFCPRVGVVLNLTPDHLARHGTMEAYGATKLRLFERMQSGWAFLPSDDAFLLGLADIHGHGGARRALLGGTPGVTRVGRRVRVELDEVVDLSLEGVTLTGAHNLDHAATAAALALAAGANAERVQEGLPGLRPLRHRMQPVAQVDGVVWIDDSKATNIASTRVGVQGLEPSAVVLLGGQAKGGGFDALVPDLLRHRAVVTFGASGPAIADELEAAGLSVVRVGSLDEAVDVARLLAQPGDAVLLSPGCASFDAFDDFEHRGRVFAALASGEQS